MILLTLKLNSGIRHQALRQIGDQLRNQPIEKILYSLDKELADKLWDQLWDQIGGNIWVQLRVK
jgi:hypothetical protein